MNTNKKKQQETHAAVSPIGFQKKRFTTHMSPIQIPQKNIGPIFFSPFCDAKENALTFFETLQSGVTKFLDPPFLR